MHWLARDDLAVMLLAAAVLILLTGAGLAWRLGRRWRRRARTVVRFRQLAQAMPQIVFITDTHGRVQFINDRWTEATGESAQSALGTGWARMIHPDDRDASLADMRRLMRSGQEVHHEHRLRYHDGIYRWQLLRSVPVLGSAGKVASWAGTSTEIDELKRAQTQLKAQSDLLSMAGHLAGLGAWAVEPASRRITWSDEACAILDMPPGSSPSLDEVFSLLSPAARDKMVAAVGECIERGTPFDVEVEMHTATGRPVWVRSIGRAVRDARGNVVRIEGAQQDITQRVRLLAEVRELNANLEEKVALRTGELARQEALFRTLAEQAPLPIWTVDPKGGATFFSRAWYDLFGGVPPRWEGYRWVELVHPQDLDAMNANWKNSRRTGEPYAGTRRLRACDGSWRSTTYRATPVRGVGGEIEFWVGVDTDITDTIARESALREANQQLEEFSYTVSHDLQSPLQRVASFAQLLEAQIDAAPHTKARHYLARIRANTDYMGKLIEGLLAVARVEQIDIVRGVVNLSDLAVEILERMQAEQPERHMAWRVDPGLVAMGDARLMRSVMENLLGNAWKFTSRSADAQITFGGSALRGEYFVRDNGAGFDMAYADKLFGTFQRLHGTDEFSGTGIGLAVVARALARQGGRIWADAAPEQGATFHFTLSPAPARLLA